MMMNSLALHVGAMLCGRERTTTVHVMEKSWCGSELFPPLMGLWIVVLSPSLSMATRPSQHIFSDDYLAKTGRD
jgi:hypothetical protein